MLVSPRSSPACFPKGILWPRRMIYLVASSILQFLLACRSSSIFCQWPRHLRPRPFRASIQFWKRWCPPGSAWSWRRSASRVGRSCTPDTVPSRRAGGLEGSHDFCRRHSRNCTLVSGGTWRHTRASGSRTWRGLWRRKQHGSFSRRSVGGSLATCYSSIRLWLWDVGYACLFSGRIRKDRFVQRWQSAWSCTARPSEAHSRVQPVPGDSGARTRDTAGSRCFARMSPGLITGDKVLPAAPGYHGLRKTMVILSRALDLLRGATPEQAHAFLSQAGIQSGAGHGVLPEQAVNVRMAPLGNPRSGWSTAPGLHAVGTRSTGGLSSRPGTLGQAPVGVEVERKPLRARRRRRRCSWRRLQSQKHCRSSGRVGQIVEGLGHSSQERQREREQARRLSLGKPAREWQQTPASFGGWRPWLDTVFASAAKNSQLAQLIASATADNLQFSRRVFLRQQFLFRCGGATRPSPRTRSHHRRRQVPVRLGTAVMVALHWLRAFFSDGLHASLKHSDRAWKACLEAGRAASRLDPASGWDQGRGRLRDILHGLVGPTLPRRAIDVEDEALLFQSWYMEPPHSTAVDFVAERLSYPPIAAHLPLDQWLPPSQLALFVDPGPSGVPPELSAPRFFNAPMAEWRKALRRMTRAQRRRQRRRGGGGSVSWSWWNGRHFAPVRETGWRQAAEVVAAAVVAAADYAKHE